MPSKAATASVTEYLARLEPKQRKALASLRRQIRQAEPGLEEVIAYGIPTYRLNGPVIHFAAQRHHLALYGVSRSGLKAIAGDLKDHRVAGTTIRFTPDNPIPAAAVKRLVAINVKANAARAAANKRKRSSGSTSTRATKR